LVAIFVILFLFLNIYYLRTLYTNRYNMKNTLLFLLLFFTSFYVFSDGTISYTYDAAGNRIARKYVTATLTRSANASNEQPDSTNVEAGLGELKVTLYPNPTRGTIVVGITGYDSQTPILLTLFTPDGKLLKSLSAQSDRTPIEMASYAAGWYLLRVVSGDKTLEFKIIKQ
jgi:hypothetical protein